MPVPKKPKAPQDPNPFPNLSKLDVSGNPLNMDVWDFLYPLANNYHLSVIVASGCNLTGKETRLRIIAAVFCFCKSLPDVLIYIYIYITS